MTHTRCDISILDAERGFPQLFDFGSSSADTFVAWYCANLAAMDEERIARGALLFRNTGLASADDFQRFLDALPLKPIAYVSGNSPRLKLKSKVYTSTELAADRTIPIHNELSYSHIWPSQVFFLCVVPAAAGGETPIADSAEILRRIPRDIAEEFERKQLRYIRNLHAGVGMGPSWQETFETTDRAVVEAFLRQGGIEFRWKDDGSLWMSQTRPAVLMHPSTGNKVWFNQVDEFHPSVNGPEIYEALLEMHDGQVEELEMFAMFGDGSLIPLAYLEAVREAVVASALTFPWHAQDLLILDNHRIAHGRNPFTGARKILVSMSL